MVVKDKKTKKRRWYNILATKNFGNTVIGETVSVDSANLIGRVVNYNLGMLTRDIKLQNVKVGFRVNKVEDNNALTEIVKYELINSYIKRVVRAGRGKLDESFVVETKDKVKLRLKIIVLTRNTVQRSVLTQMRKKLRDSFSDLLSKEDYESFLANLISHRIQMNLKRELNKVYPVAVCEVRMMVKLK